MRDHDYPYYSNGHPHMQYTVTETWRHSTIVRANYAQGYLPAPPQHMVQLHPTHSIQQYPSASNFPTQVVPSSSHQPNSWTNSLWNDFSLPQKPNQIVIQTREVSATNCQISWTLPRFAPQELNKCKQRIEIYKKGTGKLDSASRIWPANKTSLSFKTIPGATYEIKIEVISARNHMIASGEFELKAIFSLFELDKLMMLALNFTGTQMQQFTYLYRCKPKVYWDYTFNRGFEILEVYEKDLNGQPASPINERIKGLFFSAKTLADGSLPPSSPFGEIRMVVPALTLLDPRTMNMYFSDFYCNSRGNSQSKASIFPHYVTIVVCMKGSEPDIYCQQTLRKLQFDDNEFLRVIPSQFYGNPYNYFVSRKVWVEIYYTENVPMKWGRFDQIIPTGAGTSKIGGLPNNKECLVCNLHPIGSATANSDANSIEQMLRDANEAPMVDADDSEQREVTESEFKNMLTYPEMIELLDKMEKEIVATKNQENSLIKNSKILVDKIRETLKELDGEFSTIFDQIETFEKDDSKLFTDSAVAKIQEIVNEF